MTLPNVILFPQAMLPLYIFEPRYRQMLSDALASHRMLSVAMQKPGRVRESPSNVAGLGLSDRLSFAAGSFFTDPLPQADVVLMGHILHDWDLSEKKMLIVKAYEALPTGGALVVYESIIDNDRSKNAFGLMMSLNMLIETPGGFDYTGADCEGWMKDAGFTSTRTEPLIGPDSMVVGIK